jgi:hypothetical protein
MAMAVPLCLMFFLFTGESIIVQYFKWLIVNITLAIYEYNVCVDLVVDVGKCMLVSIP